MIFENLCHLVYKGTYPYYSGNDLRKRKAESSVCFIIDFL